MDSRTSKLAALLGSASLLAIASTGSAYAQMQTQTAQANPGSMGTTTKWEYKLAGNTLTLKPAASPGVEFTFERLP